jgi:hypothetical protein
MMGELIAFSDDRAFVARFVRAFLEDTVARPLPRILTAQIVLEASIARLMRVTLRLARDASFAGIAPSSLRAAFNALDVPTGLRERIERKLTTDGVVKIVGDRMVFCGTPATWNKLAETPA